MYTVFCCRYLSVAVKYYTDMISSLHIVSFNIRYVDLSMIWAKLPFCHGMICNRFPCLQRGELWLLDHSELHLLNYSPTLHLQACKMLLWAFEWSGAYWLLAWGTQSRIGWRGTERAHIPWSLSMILAARLHLLMLELVLMKLACWTDPGDRRPAVFQLAAWPCPWPW